MLVWFSVVPLSALEHIRMKNANWRRRLMILHLHLCVKSQRITLPIPAICVVDMHILLRLTVLRKPVKVVCYFQTEVKGGINGSPSIWSY